MKRGKLSLAEQKKILKYIDTKSVPHIAKLLNRNADSIKKWIDENKHLAKSPDTEGYIAAIAQMLKDKQAWKQLKQEFTPNELNTFKERYAEFMHQFRNDILPSEEIQIFHVIKLELLQSRVLSQQQKLNSEIDRLEKTRDELMKSFKSFKDMDDVDKEYIRGTEGQIESYRTAIQSYSNEYTKLQDRQAKLMTNLKATRDQRINQIENHKTSFVGIIKSLNDMEVAEREGRQVELLKMAQEKAKQELSKPHKYMDGQEDIPIYTPELVESYEAD